MNTNNNNKVPNSFCNTCRLHTKYYEMGVQLIKSNMSHALYTQPSNKRKCNFTV